MSAWPMSDEGLFSLTSLPISVKPEESTEGSSGDSGRQQGTALLPWPFPPNCPARELGAGGWGLSLASWIPILLGRLCEPQEGTPEQPVAWAA